MGMIKRYLEDVNNARDMAHYATAKAKPVTP